MHRSIFGEVGPRPRRYPFFFLFLLGLCGVIGSVYFIREINIAKNWPTVTGRNESKIDRDLNSRTRARIVSYQYTIGVHTYSAKSLHTGLTGEAPQQVQINYDPQNPARGIVKTDNMKLLLIVLAGSGVLSLTGFILLMSGETVDTGKYHQAHYKHRS